MDSGLDIALFPNTGEEWEQALHFVSAAGLFLVLAFFSLVLFTKSDRPRASWTFKKKARNTIYMICGVVMLICIVSIAVYSWFLDGTSLADLKPVFWLETFALWAFGVSWFVKGQPLWKDVEELSE